MRSNQKVIRVTVREREIEKLNHGGVFDVGGPGGGIETRSVSVVDLYFTIALHSSTQSPISGIRSTAGIA